MDAESIRLLVNIAVPLVTAGAVIGAVKADGRHVRELLNSHLDRINGDVKTLREETRETRARVNTHIDGHGRCPHIQDAT